MHGFELIYFLISDIIGTTNKLDDIWEINVSSYIVKFMTQKAKLRGYNKKFIL